MAYACQVTPVSCGNCAMKIRIASALTKPVMTERETNCISRSSRKTPATIWNSPHQDRRGEQIFDAMIANQGHHDHRHGGGCGRDHARPSAGESDHDRDGDRGIEPDAGIDAGDDGKSDGFGNERKGDDDAREHIRARIREPVAAKRGECMSLISPDTINGSDAAGWSRG